MQVLVMGGTQMLGLETVLELLRRGHEVSIFNRGTRTIDWPGPVRELRGDRNEPGDLAQLAGLSFDGAIDFSCFTGLQAELFSTVSSEIPRVVQCSSGAVYAADPALPWNEQTTPATGWPLYGTYGADKLAAEHALLQARGDRGATTILRPPYVLAPGNTSLREEWVLNRLLDGEQVLVFGDGRAVVLFVSARQVAATAVNALEAFADGGARIFNVAEPAAIASSVGFVQICAEVVGREAQVRHVEPTGPTMVRDSVFPFPSESYILDTHAAEAAGIQAPPTTLRAMIEEAYAYLLAHPERRVWSPSEVELANGTPARG